MLKSGSRKPRSRTANIARLEHAGLWKKYWRYRSVKTRNALVEALLPQAIGFARKTLSITLRGRGTTGRSFGLGLTEDEKSEIVIGLINVVERYDPSFASLGTYMWCVVRGTIFDLWRKQGWFPRRWFSEESKQDISMLSLDKIRDDYGSRSNSAQHADGWVPDVLVNQDGMKETEDAVLIRDMCLRYLSMLSGRDRLVIQRRYMEDVPFKVIAEELGVTRQRVSFIHKRSLKKLRESAEKKSR